MMSSLACDIAHAITKAEMHTLNVLNIFVTSKGGIYVARLCSNALTVVRPVCPLSCSIRYMSTNRAANDAVNVQICSLNVCLEFSQGDS